MSEYNKFLDAFKNIVRPNPNLSLSVPLVTGFEPEIQETLDPEMPDKPFITEPLMLEDGGRVGFEPGGIATRKPYGGYINNIADAFLKAYAEDDISYLGSKNKFNEKGMLSNNEVANFRSYSRHPNFIQTMVDKTGLKAEDILDLMDERDSYIESELKDLVREVPTQQTEKIVKQIDQGEDWLIENSKRYDTVEKLKKGFKRRFTEDHPFLKKRLNTPYGMPKLNPLFFEDKKSSLDFYRKTPRFDYGSAELKNLFQASLYNFNPAIRDKVLNELNKIIPKKKITVTEKYDLRKKFENSKILSELGINEKLTGPVTRLLIKDLGENIIENINFIKYPRVQVADYIKFLKDKVDPKYREQFQLVDKALDQLHSKNYNGLKKTLKIVENINLDHKVPRFLIDAGYADEIEYIKLNPIGEKFNQIVKNSNFDRPLSFLLRKYKATNVPEEKTKIVQKMNELKDSFNKRYNNYLSGIDIKEIDGKLNMSSSFEPITSADEFLKVLETNVKQNPELFKIQDNIKNKTKIFLSKEAANVANEISDDKKLARKVCNSLSSGGLPGDCLEASKKNPEKFLTIASDQNKRAANALNLAKRVSTFTEEVIGFGTGLGGRSLGALTALNLALDQFNVGNYAEGFRRVGRFVDLSTFVGYQGFQDFLNDQTRNEFRKKLPEKEQKIFDKTLQDVKEYEDYNDTLQKLETENSNYAFAQTQEPGTYNLDTIYKDISTLENEVDSKFKKLKPKISKMQENLSYLRDFSIEQLKKNVPVDAKPGFKNKVEFSAPTAVDEQMSVLFKSAYNNSFKKESEKVEVEDKNPIDLSTFEGVGPPGEYSRGGLTNLSDQDLQSLADVMPKEFVTQAAVKYAKGGRVNFNEGGSGRRGFLKFLIGLGISSGLLKGLKTGDTAKDVIKITKPIKLANQFKNAPSWFGDLLSVIAKPENITDDLKQIDGSPALGKTYSSQGVKIVEDDKTIDVMFETDNGMRGYIVYTKPSEVVDPKTGKIQKIPGEYQEYELIYRGDGENYTKDWEEGIVSGKSNLIETSGNKASKEELAQASRFADEQSAAEARMEADLDFLESQKDEID